MGIVNANLVLKIPQMEHLKTIEVFVDWRWITLILRSSTITMNFDGHDFTSKWDDEEKRFRKIFFLSSTANRMELFLRASITGRILERQNQRKSVQEDCLIFTELHVSQLKFETTTEILQSKHAVEEENDFMFLRLMQLVKKR